MNKILLSILIPAYNFEKGISRILNKLEYHQDIEIIIFDNSSNNNVYFLFQKYRSKFKSNFIYKKYKTNSAVENWNNLIQYANGKYFILLHHDELIIFNTSYIDFINYLKFSNKNLIYLNCIVLKKISILHFHHFFVKIAIKYMPEYIFKRNFIGPTACLIIEKNIFNYFFDEKLNWFVDVEFYYRHFKHRNLKFDFCNKLQVISYQDNKNSITKSIKQNISKIIDKERIYLKTKHNISNNFRNFEFISWYGLRIILIPYSFYYTCKLKFKC
jgi:hypothetical protein